MTSNGKTLAARRGEKPIVETLKQIGLVARLCASPLSNGLMVSRPQAALELAHIFGRPIEQKELAAALKAADIFEGSLDDFARRRPADRKKLERETAR
jgi:hypothetical protein